MSSPHIESDEKNKSTETGHIHVDHHAHHTNPEPSATRLFFSELIKMIIFCLVVVIPLRWFVVGTFIVFGTSMFPTFHNNEYLIVNKLIYRFEEPKRGEVIVFRNPKNLDEHFIKRVIALPGDSIKGTEGKVYLKVKGGDTYKEIDESYLPTGTQTWQFGPELTLGDKEYFVLGDNRGYSSDSRSWGLLPREDIEGRVLIRFFPFSRVQLFSFEEPHLK